MMGRILGFVLLIGLSACEHETTCERYARVQAACAHQLGEGPIAGQRDDEVTRCDERWARMEDNEQSSFANFVECFADIDCINETHATEGYLDCL